MRILIVEDEAVAARGIERMLREILGHTIQSLRIQHTLVASELFLHDHPIDLLFLDLNLNGDDGFDLLMHAVSGSFQTVVISACLDRAVEAFQYGVLDFVPKPITRERLAKAIERYENGSDRVAEPVSIVTVRRDDTIRLIPVDSITFLEAAGNTNVIHMKDGTVETHRKTLDAMLRMMPVYFTRIHKSYAVDRREIRNFRVRAGGKYEALLTGGAVLPVSRSRYRDLIDQK